MRPETSTQSVPRLTLLIPSNPINGTSGGAPTGIPPGSPWMISLREATADVAQKMSPALLWMQLAMSMSAAWPIMLRATKPGPFVKVSPARRSPPWTLCRTLTQWLCSLIRRPASSPSAEGPSPPRTKQVVFGWSGAAPTAARPGLILIRFRSRAEMGHAHLASAPTRMATSKSSDTGPQPAEATTFIIGWYARALTTATRGVQRTTFNRAAVTTPTPKPDGLQ